MTSSRFILQKPEGYAYFKDPYIFLHFICTCQGKYEKFSSDTSKIKRECFHRLLMVEKSVQFFELKIISATKYKQLSQKI